MERQLAIDTFTGHEREKTKQNIVGNQPFPSGKGEGNENRKKNKTVASDD
jgi:hypothetical protein